MQMQMQMQMQMRMQKAKACLSEVVKLAEAQGPQALVWLETELPAILKAGCSP